MHSKATTRGHHSLPSHKRFSTAPLPSVQDSNRSVTVQRDTLALRLRAGARHLKHVVDSRGTARHENEAVPAARLEERHQAAAAAVQRQAERNSPEPKKGVAWEEVASQAVTEAGADLEAAVVVPSPSEASTSTDSRPSDFYPTLRQNTAATRMQAIQRGKSSRAMASRSRASAGGSIRVT